MSIACGVLMMEGSSAVKFGTPERVEWHLDNWCRWMRSGQESRGYGSQAVGLSDGGTSKGFDEMVEAEDRRSAKIVNAILNNLPPVERIAIYIERGIVLRVFTFERITYHQAIGNAKATLARELNRRGVW